MNWYPMITLNIISPDNMSEDERLAEIAHLIASGLMRLRACQAKLKSKSPQPGLAISTPKSVHTDPSKRVRVRVREALLQKMKGH